MTAHQTTESSSNYNDLEKKSILELISSINNEDLKVAQGVKKSLPQIEKLIAAVVEKMKAGGRLFYIGAGTSGRLGILDASEIPPTYGVDDAVIGLIAGGDKAIRKAVENAEDDLNQAWKDLSVYKISTNDFLIGIAASGATPYVLGGLNVAKQNGISTGCIVCNTGSVIANAADHSIELITGPEFVTGSTRMKAGTAQKMVLNMISTTAMIQLGKVKGNKMLEMQLSNNKLWNRAANMLSQELNISKEEALELIQQYKSVKKAIIAYQAKKNAQ
ncbi:MAG: N-acetylmuramic acid 6-phosphate etherase [Chitinophagaceae bacterium]|nr:N-acetylmuramic acid 6-phosphate etherase [Chitinophagaceae bacterium]